MKINQILTFAEDIIRNFFYPIIGCALLIMNFTVFLTKAMSSSDQAVRYTCLIMIVFVLPFLLYKALFVPFLIWVQKVYKNANEEKREQL